MMLSICIPTYNRKCELERQLKTFLPFVNDNKEKVELIVSDNDSKDGTAKYLESLKDQYPWIVVNVNKKNVGLVGNLFKVSALAKNKYLWVVGDDDTVFSDTPKKVLDILENQNNISHVFLNYKTVLENNEIQSKVYNGKSGYTEDGLEMFSSITRNANIGSNMFLSANIYKRELVCEANDIILRNDENDNLALPLGWSLFCSKQSGYIIDDVCLENRLDGISWSSSKVRVFYRDNIAICDMLAKEMGREKEINQLLIENRPASYPAIKFMILNRDKNLDNYAAKWLRKNFMGIYITDCIKFPFYLIKIGIREIKKRVLN